MSCQERSLADNATPNEVNHFSYLSGTICTDRGAFGDQEKQGGDPVLPLHADIINSGSDNPPQFRLLEIWRAIRHGFSALENLGGSMARQQQPARLGLVIALSFSMVSFFLASNHLKAEPTPGPGSPFNSNAGSVEPPLAGSPAPGLGNADERSACPEDPPVPVVQIRVRVPAAAAMGQDLEYHICVENCSDAPAHHVLVRNPLPANARFIRANPEPSSREPELQWQLGTLPGCGCREILLVLSPTGAGDVNNCARVQFEHGQCVCTRISRPSFSLHKTGPTQAILYDSLTFQLTVTNTGSSDLKGVLLSDTLPAGLEHSSGKNPLTWEVGNLAPGQSRSVEYQVVAKGSGQLCNRAVATAEGGLHEEAQSCVTIAEARMTLAKTGPSRRYVSIAAPYQITVTNAGSAPLTNVVINDPVPPQMTFVSASAGGQLNGNQVRWAIGNLEPGAARNLEVVLRAQAPGKLCNRASAVADRGVTAQAEFCTDFVGASGLLLEVIDTDDPVEVGGETSYIITVLNQGTLPATDLLVVAEIPAEMVLTRATGPSDNRQEGPKVIFQPMTLAPKNEARFVVHVKAIKAGDVRFKVDLSSQQLPSGPVHEEESTTIYLDNPSAPPKAPEGVRQSKLKTHSWLDLPTGIFRNPFDNALATFHTSTLRFGLGKLV